MVSIIRLQTLVAAANSTDPTFDNPPAALASAIETNVAIICACLPSMRPLLAAMMPAYFPEGSQYTNTINSWRYDAEQPKHMRTFSADSRPHTAASPRNPGHSRSGSAASSAYSHSNSRGPSRTGSIDRAYIPNSPYYPQQQRQQGANHSRSNSRSGHVRTLSKSRKVTELQPLPNSRRVASPEPAPAARTEHYHPINPLGMSPYSPMVPRLPRLPENMAVLAPLEQSWRQGMGMRERPVRIPLFHKPLPITPLPGYKNAPQYLTPAQDQAMLPIQLSPGLVPAGMGRPPSPNLVPQPLNVGAKSPRTFAF